MKTFEFWTVAYTDKDNRIQYVGGTFLTKEAALAEFNKSHHFGGNTFLGYQKTSESELEVA